MDGCTVRGDGLCNERSNSWLAMVFPFFTLDKYVHLGVDNGAEIDGPDFLMFLSAETLIPLLFYIFVWWFVNETVKYRCWLGTKDFARRRRLHNLTTSLIHSCTSSTLLFLFIRHSSHLMFAAPMHFYGFWQTQVVSLSVGYFIYDGLDMLTNDDPMVLTSVIVFIHHVGSIYVLMAALASKKFILYAYWALLMEVSSIFIHSRSILHISKLSTGQLKQFSRFMGYANVVLYVVFRFFVQFFLIGWAWVNRRLMHQTFRWIGFGGGSLFLAINTGIFLRILRSDGLFSEERHDQTEKTRTTTRHHKNE